MINYLHANKNSLLKKIATMLQEVNLQTRNDSDSDPKTSDHHSIDRNDDEKRPPNNHSSLGGSSNRISTSSSSVS